MLLKEFPDIRRVRRLRNEPSKSADTWMNVALNINCKQVSRTGVESPYSLFINRKGHSFCAVNRQQYRIETDKFLFTQPGDIYDLLIDNTNGTEICNIHINRDFFNNAVYSLTASSARQLATPYTGGETGIRFLTQLHEIDSTAKHLVSKLAHLPAGDSAGFEIVLIDLISHLLLMDGTVRAKIAAMPFMKANVREDIYKRLAYARDYIYSHYSNAIHLDTICTEVGMSKFHFLRMFRALFGITPHQYLSEIRMAKAAELLKNSGQPINEIAASLGFEYPSSLIKAFRKAYHTAPQQYRKEAK